MINEFSKKTRDLFDMGGWCYSWETGTNDADCLHHIMGRVSSSPYNAAPLNNRRDHQPEGRKGLPSIHSLEVRKKYLLLTKQYLDSVDYHPTKDDLLFLDMHKKFYE